MLTKGELEEILASTGACCVERTKAMTDKNKFGEAVCAVTAGGRMEAK